MCLQEKDRFLARQERKKDSLKDLLITSERNTGQQISLCYVSELITKWAGYKNENQWACCCV